MDKFILLAALFIFLGFTSPEKDNAGANNNLRQKQADNSSTIQLRNATDSSSLRIDFVASVVK